MKILKIFTFRYKRNKAIEFWPIPAVSIRIEGKDANYLGSKPRLLVYVVWMFWGFDFIFKL